MKVLNVSEQTVFLDDINIAITYNRSNEPIEIPNKLARSSKTLRVALQLEMLIDVTDGIPDIIPKYDPKPAVDPGSPFLKRQGMLSNNDHNPPPAKPEKNKSPMRHGKSAFDIYKEEGKISIAWSGPSRDAGGYARMNREFMFGLEKRGVSLYHDPVPSMQDMDAETTTKLNKLSSIIVPQDAPKVYGMTAPLHYDWGRYKMLFTMMETRRLHKDYTERCNCADEIVVPSRWCRDTFLESGVKKPMTVIPLGIDTKLYNPNVEPIGFSKNLKPFIFLSVFGWSLRKGYDVLLRAYLEEFTSDDPVTLLISSRYMGSTDESKKAVIRNDIAQISSMVSNPKKPQIILFGDVLSDTMLPRLYAAADCYVLISRGEGFGLPFGEAGACNLPVIASRYSGHTDFLDDDNSYLVDVDGFRSAETSLSWISYFYDQAEFPIFGKKAVEQTRYFMRRVFENKEEAEKKANKLHQRIMSEYNWDVCVDKMHKTLKTTFDLICGERK